MEQQLDFQSRLEAIQLRMAAACERAARAPEEVELIAVTKNFPPEAVREAWEHGLRIMGENRVQEAAAKIPASISGPSWHLIGHLQRNKVRKALELFEVLHAIDSARLAEQVARIADEIGARPRILLEVNVSAEASKFGLSPAEVPAVIEQILALPAVTLEGVMTMAPYSPEPEDARPFFAELRNWRDRWQEEFAISLPQLSMGMSGDFEVAIEEGATWIRIGTALFGSRPRWRPAGSEDLEEGEWLLD